jgi:hypothetical protein
MDISDFKKPIITAVVTIVVGIIVYSLIGVAMYISGTVIYDGTPTEFSCYPNNPEWELDINVRNNAAATLPFINPFYGVKAKVEGNNDTFAYFMGLGNSPRNFTDYYLDIGKIDSGSERPVAIKLHVAEGNFSLTVDVYLKFLLNMKAASVTYLVEYEGNYDYNITRLR